MTQINDVSLTLDNPLEAQVVAIIIPHMSIAEVSKLPLREKLQIMEAIWHDLSEHVEMCDVPLEHRELLDRRRARVAAGAVVLRDWDAVKHTIGS